MKQLIRIKKIIFRAFFFIFYPERCVPRAIRYDNQQWYLSEGKQDEGTGRMATEVSYIGFKGQELFIKNLIKTNNFYHFFYLT